MDIEMKVLNGAVFIIITYCIFTLKA